MLIELEIYILTLSKLVYTFNNAIKSKEEKLSFLTFSVK